LWVAYLSPWFGTLTARLPLSGSRGAWELRRTPLRRSSQNSPSTHSGEYLVRGLSVQHHQRPPGEEVGDVTVGMLVANIVAVGHARVS
jgi:hypothetical protein